MTIKIEKKAKVNSILSNNFDEGIIKIK